MVGTNEHERDAILGAITACAQTERRQGWRNLFEIERYPIIPFNYSVGYWIPWDLVKQLIVSRLHSGKK